MNVRCVILGVVSYHFNIVQARIWDQFGGGWTPKSPFIQDIVDIVQNFHNE
jgi:hypothetical protein